jgi:hypothetical protein
MKFDFPTPFGPIGGWEGGGWLKVDGGWWERTPRHSGVPGAPEHGKDAFHRVPDSARNEWDAVERVLTILEDRFRGRASPTVPLLLTDH